MEGNIDQAKFELEQVLVYSSRTQYIFKNEAIAIYGLIMAHFDNDPGSAWNLLQKSSLNPAQSPLTAYIFSSLALKNGDNDLAISYLQGSPKGVQYYSFPYLDFMLGTAKLRRLDADAPIYLNKYLHEFKGIHFIKECYQKLAWSELLHDNVSGYTQQMHNVKKYGAHVVDEDKQALRESDRGIIPQVTLLKARLLSDGGYYKRALELLESEQSLLQHPDYTLEANYRLGRIYHLEKKYTLAIPYYQKAIEKGVQSTTHYACASSLYIGTIYEIQKNFKLARFYFQKCLAITSGDYTSSLHQKAKAGLNRINE
jgi:tetratricopeptide (TPR) repeat protein